MANSAICDPSVRAYALNLRRRQIWTTLLMSSFRNIIRVCTSRSSLNEAHGDRRDSPASNGSAAIARIATCGVQYDSVEIPSRIDGFDSKLQETNHRTCHATSATGTEIFRCAWDNIVHRNSNDGVASTDAGHISESRIRIIVAACYGDSCAWCRSKNVLP